MAQEWSKVFYNLKRWRKCRAAYISARIARDGGFCEHCKKDLGYEVHHKIKLTQKNISNPEITLNQKYLEYLCHDCHSEEHNAKNFYIKFDSDGQPIPP